MRITRTMVLATCLPLAGGLMAGQEQHVTELEQRITALEQKASSGRGWTDRIEMNGFITYGMTRHNVHQEEVDGEPVTYIDRTTDEISHQELSRAGVQFNAAINDRTQAVVQLLARGRENYDAKAQWAYLDYTLSPSVHVRGGRLVLPFMMHSQYSNVGYAYHWAALPGEAYDVVPFDTMDGFDLTWDFHTGPVAHSLNAYVASMDVPSLALPAPVTYQVRDMGGINLSSTWNNLSTWLSYNHSQVSLDLTDLAEPIGKAMGTDPDNIRPALAPPVSLEDENTYVSSVGVQYDNGTVMLMAERTELGIAGWFPTKWGGYVSAGYRIGKWMPHLTWSAANSHGVSEAAEDGPFAEAFSASNQVRSKSWTLGARYEVSPGLALKAEVQRFYDFSNDKIKTNGLFSNRSPLFGLPEGIDRDDPMVFRFTVDAAF